MTMAGSSTPRRQWDIRGVEINGIFVPATPRVLDNPSPPRRAMSRNPSLTRRSMSRNPSPPRRSMSKNPSPTRRRVVSKAAAPSPTRRRSVSKAPSPTRRAASPRSRRRSVSRHPSPQRGGRRRGPSPSRQQHAAPPSTSGRTESRRPANSSRRMSTGGSRSRAQLPSDSEGEAEPRYARKLNRSFNSSDNESPKLSPGGKRASGMRARRTSGSQTELRSSFTNVDVSDTTTTPVYYQKPEELHRNAGEINGNREEAQAGEEVKTIHEVLTRTKVPTFCYNNLYDVSSSPSDVVSPMGSVQNSREAPPGDSPDFVRRASSNELELVKEDYLRKAMEPKLELSEVFDLWSQCTTEEGRKFLDSVKSVKKEFSEGTLPEGLKPQPKHRYPMDMEESDCNIKQSLDEEAARYLEDCVILANFDSTVADDISVSTATVSDDESTVWNDPGPPFRCQSSESSSVRSKAIVPLDDEGMVLPWLDLEPEVDLERKEKAVAVVDFQGWKSASARKSVEWGRTLNRERGKDEGAVNVDEFLFERTRLQPRISHGRMLVCGGKR